MTSNFSGLPCAWMEAWILHIRKEEYGSVDPDILYCSNEYSAWMTEKQARRRVSEYLDTQVAVDYWHRGDFCDQPALCDTIRVLLTFNHVEEAIALVNEYSSATKPKPLPTCSKRVEINIVKSEFLGSAFD